MTDQTATPGTHFAGPLRIESLDPAQTDFTALPTATDDQTGGTADTTDYTLADVGASFSQATLNNNFATLAALLDALLERVQ